MPTPFTHLHIANQILATFPALDALQMRRGDFLLGNIAPDLSSINGLQREETHFFPLPPRAGEQGITNFLRQHPQFTDPRRLPAATAAFIAGYLAHLLADEIWIWRIFVPHIILADLTPENVQKKLIVHNAIRTYVDREDRANLASSTRANLLACATNDVLPFVSGDTLHTWRQRFCDQLLPGVPVQTVEVFARRMGVTPEILERCLADELAQPDEIFRAIVPTALSEFRREVVQSGGELIGQYLRGDWRDGACTRFWGACTRLWGACTRLWGACTRFWGASARHRATNGSDGHLGCRHLGCTRLWSACALGNCPDSAVSQDIDWDELARGWRFIHQVDKRNARRT